MEIKNSVGDEYIIQVPTQEANQLKFNGMVLEWVRCDTHDYMKAVEHGVVLAKPKALYNKAYPEDEEIIPVGSKVYFHYHVSSDIQHRTDLGKDVFRANHWQIFAYVLPGTDEMIMNLGYVFVDPVFEDQAEFVSESGIYLKPYDEPKEIRPLAKVVCNNKRLKEMGVETGDTIAYEFNRNVKADCKIQIDGKELYRMTVDDILAVV